jgi:dihydroorotase
MNPPLRLPGDVAAVREALLDGTIDLIATDHAPHSPGEKRLPLDEAPFGVIGLETSLAVSLTELVRSGLTTLRELLARMSWAPASTFGLPGGKLEVGGPADVVVLDPEAAWTIDPAQFRSKGRNCPFAGREVCGRVSAVFVAGVLRVRDAMLTGGPDG